jgi:DNA polymerase-1
MLASQLLTAGIPGKHSLKDIALKYLDIELNKESQKSDWSGELSPAQLEYAALDSAVLLQLQEVLKLNLIEAELLEAAEIEFSAIAATGEMELSGILLNKSKWEQWGIELKEFLDGEAVELEKQLLSRNCQMNIFPETEKINLNSHKQVLKALQKMGIPVESTGKQALVHLADEYPIITPLLEYKKHSKAVSSFCSSWSEHIDSITGRIYSDYVQLGSANGRFSCRKPNLQQVPREKEVRSCFIPAPGNQLVIADYSQIELRVAAEISGDRRMIEAYRNNEDLHKLTASLVTGKPIDQISKNERQAAKAVNFGLIYGCGAKRLKQQAKQDYGVELSLEECETFRKRFFKAYRGVAQWHKKLINSNLWETRTLSGRRRTWTDKQPWITGLAPAIVSGSASDIAKRALAMLPIALEETGAKLVAFVHDEFLLECPESTAINAAKILQDTMIKAGETYLNIVPVKAEVKIAESWADK